MAAEVVELHTSPEREQSRAEKRLARRRTAFIERNSRATTPRERLDAAMDYFRGVTAELRIDPAKAGVATEHHAERLVASADQLAKTIRRPR
jgi:hypothetical protein